VQFVSQLPGTGRQLAKHINRKDWSTALQQHSAITDGLSPVQFAETEIFTKN